MRERLARGGSIVADHFTEAALDDLAIEWWGRAGDAALRRSAFEEAIAHLRKAMAMADKAATAATSAIPGTTPRQRVKLRRDYAQAVLWSNGWAADETKAAFERASDLATRAELSAERFPTFHDLALWS